MTKETAKAAPKAPAPDTPVVETAPIPHPVTEPLPGAPDPVAAAPEEKLPTKAAVSKALYAIHEINPFGSGKHAPARTIFVPTTAAERKELLDLGAARELEEHEAAAFATGAPVDDDDFA